MPESSRSASSRRRDGTAGAILFPLLLLLASGGPAGPPALEAHEEAVLESPASAVPAGGVLPLSGRDFAKDESYALRLRGALRVYELGEAEADGDGGFSLELELPAAVEPGAYQLLAVAADGDIVARLDLQVLPAGAGAAGGGAAPTGGHARTDDIRIERERSGAEWGAIGLLIGLAAGLGVGLLRREGRGAGA